MAKALEIWSFEAIEEALGTDVERALPPSIRLADLHVRIPRCHIAMLELMAQRERTSVNTVLTRELELSASIAGFETVLNWPDPGGAPLRG